MLIRTGSIGDLDRYFKERQEKLDKAYRNQSKETWLINNPGHSADSVLTVEEVKDWLPMHPKVDKESIDKIAYRLHKGTIVKTRTKLYKLWKNIDEWFKHDTVLEQCQFHRFIYLPKHK